MPKRALSKKNTARVISDHFDGMSERELARKYGVSQTAIRTALADEEEAQIVAEKTRACACDILEYVSSKKKITCDILDKILNVVNDAEYLKSAKPQNLAVLYGVLIDKTAAVADLNRSRGGNDIGEEDALTRSIMDEAKRLNEERAMRHEQEQAKPCTDDDTGEGNPGAQ